MVLDNSKVTENSRRSWLRIIGIVLIGILALTVFIESGQVSRDNVRIDSLESQISNFQAGLSNSQTSFQQVQAQNSQLTNQVTSLMKENTRLSSEVLHPTVSMWNVPTTISSGEWRALVVPDTFDYNVSFSSETKITVFFFNLDQFVKFHDCGQSCVTGSYVCFPNCTTATTSLSNQVFTLAEACAGYVSVFYQPSTVPGSGKIRPDVLIKYNPAASLTGWCAQ